MERLKVVQFVNVLVSPLSIAPMIDWTYTHFRVFMRILAPCALLYTDMQTPGAIFNNPARALSYHPVEHPLALQVGSADKEALVKCATLAEKLGFSEVNLNLGCPSDRVQAGRFGACMMAEPALVAQCIAAMKRAVNIPITAKTRIGINENDSFDFFEQFVSQLIDAGCDKLIVHARKAWLHGLNPKQNRTIPPLHYDYAYNIKKTIPLIPVVINGNINTVTEINDHLKQVDGVMLGRLACNNPYQIAVIHHALYPAFQLKSRSSVVEDYIHYVFSIYRKGSPLSLLLKPILNMAHGLPGAKQWKEKVTTIQHTGDVHTLLSVAELLASMERNSTEKNLKQY